MKIKIYDKEINELTDQKLFLILDKEKEVADNEQKRKDDEQRLIDQ